jgi:FkbM family methyltransferase
MIAAWLRSAREALGRVIATHDTPLSADALVMLGVRYPAQCGQDHWVIETLQGLRGGYFVDVGASNGVISNNTWALERCYGWRGVCIEANPAFLPTLRRHRQVPCVDTVVWDEDDAEVAFHPAGPCSGVVSDETDNKSGEGVSMPRQTRTLASILREVGAPPVIDYLSIDIEGAEGRVLRTFPFDQFMVRLMTVERPTAELESLLAERGFRLANRIISPEGKPVDSFYVHRSVGHS